MDLETVKTYLRIDEEADDTIILLMIDAVEQYITDAVGNFDKTNPKTKMLFFLLMQEFYENRTLMQNSEREQKISHIAQSIILQLQVEELMKDGEVIA